MVTEAMDELLMAVEHLRSALLQMEVRVRRYEVLLEEATAVRGREQDISGS